jgi:hypothetical protein
VQIRTVLEKLADGRKGPCWGYLKDGDVITHVNGEPVPVDGKDNRKVVELFNSSGEAIIDVVRVEGIMACSLQHWVFRALVIIVLPGGVSKKLGIKVRIPLGRPGIHCMLLISTFR